MGVAINGKSLKPGITKLERRILSLIVMQANADIYSVRGNLRRKKEAIKILKKLGHL